MNNRSMHDRVEVKRHINGAVSSTQTPSNGVDLQDLHTAEIVVDIGTVTNIANSPQPSWTFALQHSDTVNSDFEAVESTDVVLPDGDSLGASGVFATVDAAAEDDAIYRVGYVGAKRYVRVVATAANTPGSTPIAVVVVGEKMLTT